MSGQSIVLDRVTIAFNHKTLFTDFSAHIYPGSRIAFIGRNGSGKSTLLQIILGKISSLQGRVIVPPGLVFGFVPQIVPEIDKPLSGGQRFNYALSAALAKNPDVLCLDEPTNHLDHDNRKSLLKMLHNYHGTLIVVSHDVELLRSSIDQIWHIGDDQKIHIFHGTYDDYQRERSIAHNAQLKQIEALNKQKRKLRADVQAEQMRAAGSRRANKNESDKLLLGAMKESGARTEAKNAKRLRQNQERVAHELGELRLPEEITPSFGLRVDRKYSAGKYVVSVSGGSCGYPVAQETVLHNISLTLDATDRVAIVGPNASGKSTLIKALLGDNHIVRQGTWSVPHRDDIGYLDQHYQILNEHDSVLQAVEHAVPAWSHNEVRRHLNNFLFRSNEEVGAAIKTLSGGEKVRLVLAVIAARNPALLILDEVTNNLDLEMRQHVITTLNAYQGAIIVISHDQDFLDTIGITSTYRIKNGTLALA